MALFMLLILPLPFAMRRKVFTYATSIFPAAPETISVRLTARYSSFISENPLVAKVQYWLKITFIFILILFIDSVNRVYRVQVELAAATENTGTSAYVLLLPHPKLHI
jgi:hypothetical protein